MYMSKVLEIGKAENGFVISCSVPIKKDKKKEEKDMVESYPGSCEKMYLAKDGSEVGEIVQKLMPMLDMDFKSEEDFDKAFNEAAGKEK